jgi:hypothetical protein
MALVDMTSIMESQTVGAATFVDCTQLPPIILCTLQWWYEMICIMESQTVATTKHSKPVVGGFGRKDLYDGCSSIFWFVTPVMLLNR